MLPGLLTSFVYFIGRSVYAAIIFHNFQALIGVMSNAQIAQLIHLHYPMLVIAALSVSALVFSDRVIMRRNSNPHENNV
jgi:hypothetical protein